MPPIQTSGKCCFLMREHSRLVRLTGNPDGSPEVRRTFCRVCFAACVEQLWRMLVIGAPCHWTYPSLIWSKMHGGTRVTLTVRARMCSTAR
mmetsp:Transcript_22509/g.70155  ORF Transcript_22509/g.70155 Transcript_22509/m.70155 type:complete len:91 (+) Transcript_22509:273-545(+)